MKASDVYVFGIMIVLSAFPPVLFAFLESFHSAKSVDLEKDTRDRLLMLIPLAVLLFHYKATTKIWRPVGLLMEPDTKVAISSASRPLRFSLFLQLPFFHQVIFDALTPAQRITFVVLGNEVKKCSKVDLLARTLFLVPFIILPLSIVSVLESTYPANMILIVFLVHFTIILFSHLCIHFSSRNLTKVALERIKNHPDESESIHRIFEVIHKHPNHLFPGIPAIRRWDSKRALDQIVASTT